MFDRFMSRNYKLDLEPILPAADSYDLYFGAMHSLESVLDRLQEVECGPDLTSFFISTYGVCDAGRDGNKANDAILKAIVSIIKNNNNLKKLYVSSIDINDFWCRQISDALLLNTGLETLDLTGVKNISSAGINIIISATNYNTSLKFLSFDETRDDDIAVHSSILKENNSLNIQIESLREEDSRMHDFLYILAPALVSIHTLTDSSLAILPKEILFEIMNIIMVGKDIDIAPGVEFTQNFSGLCEIFPKARIDKVLMVRDHQALLKQHANLMELFSKDNLADFSDCSKADLLKLIAKPFLLTAPVDSKLKAIDCLLYIEAIDGDLAQENNNLLNRLASAVCSERYEEVTESYVNILIASRKEALFAHEAISSEVGDVRDYSGTVDEGRSCLIQ